MASNETVRATVYLQLAPEYWSYRDRSKPESVRGARVVNSTQGKAEKPRPGTVEVKLTIEIPKVAFVPLQPEATVIVPADLTDPHPVTVEAFDATEDVP